MLRFRVIRTAQGYAGLLAWRCGLRRVYLPFRDRESLINAIQREAADAEEDSGLMSGFAQTLRRYFAGEPVAFRVKCDWSGGTRFEIEVWRACQLISYGHTCTYKQLAEVLGRPAAARAVGRALGRNRCPIVVPCHRVLRSDGSLGGFSAPGGLELKRRLLAMEAARG